MTKLQSPDKYRCVWCRYKCGSVRRGTALGGIPANKIASSSYSPLATAAAPVSRPIGSAGTVRINFRTSPFYEIKQFVSPIVQCPEAPTQTDRRNATLFVTFTGEQAEQLRSASHQLRLFCTTVEAHAASLSGRNPAIIEFPLTCEARVNNTPLSINLRGSKKNIGRVPPPNLNKDHALMLIEGKPNRIDLTYTNAPKRHALVAAICQITSVETWSNDCDPSSSAARRKSSPRCAERPRTTRSKQAQRL